jgi:DNA-binding HxlR family transcriptional regulator
LDWRDVDTTNCGVAACAELIADYWCILILRDILAGVSKFGELQAHTGISTAILSNRLKWLEEAALIATMAYQQPGQRKRTEYTIAPKGLALVPIIVAMGQFGYDHLIPSQNRLVEYLDRETQQPVRVGFVREDGQVRQLHELEMRVTPTAHAPDFKAPPSRKR